MPITKEVKIMKVPLADKDRLPDYPKRFPAQQQLYLELIENKDKIKQELINKDYQPVATDKVQPTKKQEEKKIEDTEIVETKEDKESKSVSVSSSASSKSSDSSDSSSSSESSKSGSKSSDSSKSGSKSSKSGSDSSKSSKSSDSSDSSSSKNDSDETDDLSDRLKELLKSKASKSSDSSSGSKKEAQKSTDTKKSKYTPYDKFKHEKELKEAKEPKEPAPTLAELEKMGQYQRTKHMIDTTYVSKNEQEDEEAKRQLIFKFDILRRSYPLSASTIPSDFTIHSDYGEMVKTYEHTLKRLSLDSSVEQYKMFLMAGFVVVEMGFGNYLGFDMQGFTQQQMLNMSSYDRLLFELGEKSYVPTGSKWPVELRLMGMIMFNAGVFIFSKMFMRNTGSNLMNMVNSFAAHAPVAPTDAGRPKRRMRGPVVNVDDIPDAETISAQDQKGA